MQPRCLLMLQAPSEARLTLYTVKRWESGPNLVLHMSNAQSQACTSIDFHPSESDHESIVQLIAALTEWLKSHPPFASTPKDPDTCKTNP